MSTEGVAAAAIAAAWLVFTQVAYAVSTANTGKKAANSKTDNAASERSLFILVSLP